MLVKLVLFFSMVVACLSDEVERSIEIDPVLYYLLNGEYEESMPPVNVETEDLEVNGGIWKCGMCDDVSQLKLIYSESNVDEIVDDSSIQKVEVSLPGLKCVIVRSSSSNIVRSVKGDCEGPSVTLSLASTDRFTLDVYGDDNDGESDT